jgi:hypothetical protein
MKEKYLDCWRIEIGYGLFKSNLEHSDAEFLCHRKRPQPATDTVDGQHALDAVTNVRTKSAPNSKKKRIAV